MGRGTVPGAGGAAESIDSLSSGAVLADKYELLHAIGSGGMGVVWAARHRESGARVALKFLRAGAQGGEDDDSRKRFLREARAAAAVHHPNVVEIREVLELADGRPVMVMELLSGETLRTRLTRSACLTLEETARILLPVASAVGTAHERGIVHRDLKPDNIFLSEDPSGALLVKVLDFGIAKLTRSADEYTAHAPALTGSGEVLGTPNYMSPEQVFGERDIDQRSDIWSLGVILYECLTGVVPTKAPNVGQVFKLIVAGGIRPLDGVRPDTPDEVIQLVHRMLARRREHRPFDLNALARVLGRYTDVRVLAFGPPHIPGVVETHPAPNADETIRRPGVTDAVLGTENRSLGPSHRRRLGRLTTLGLGTLVVTVLVAESFLLWRTPRTGSSASTPAATGASPASGSAPPQPGREDSSEVTADAGVAASQASLGVPAGLPVSPPRTAGEVRPLVTPSAREYPLAP